VDLLNPLYTADGSDKRVLDLADGWTRRWTATWKVAGSEVICPVRDMGSMAAAGCQPVRPFSWRTTQRHRPGQEAMVSTGRLHGFESIAEQKLLLALDFAGNVLDVVSQPMKIRFTTTGKPIEHTPDFLVTSRDGVWLIDVRPAHLIEEDDRVKFAASAEAALVCDWQYVVVAGWRPQVMTVLDDLSAQRRPLADPLGLQQQLLQTAAGGPHSFRDLMAGTSVPAVGRAHAVHLIWHRQLSIDLAQPLTDASPVRIAPAGGNR
jgi:hypothetical protein